MSLQFSVLLAAFASCNALSLMYPSIPYYNYGFQPASAPLLFTHDIAVQTTGLARAEQRRVPYEELLSAPPRFHSCPISRDQRNQCYTLLVTGMQEEFEASSIERPFQPLIKKGETIPEFEERLLEHDKIINERLREATKKGCETLKEEVKKLTELHGINFCCDVDCYCASMEKEDEEAEAKTCGGRRVDLILLNKKQ